MISRITIDNVTSYKEPVRIETNSKVNLFYGLNGSGKTTISNYLSSLGYEEFRDCSVEGFDESRHKILVYNQKFVTDNFHESDAQQGIFTLARENKEAVKIIKEAESQKQELLNKISGEDGLEQQKRLNSQEMARKVAEVQDKVWEIRTNDTDGGSIFGKAGFLDGLKGDKKRLFEHLLGIEVCGANIRELDEIKNNLEELGEGAKERALVMKVNINLCEIERNSIFQEPIIGNDNSSISGLISKLGNSDWIQQGLKYLPKANDHTCPFCQQSTLTLDLQTQIKDYFDEAYRTKIATLTKLKESYKLELRSSDYMSDFFEEVDKERLRWLFSDLRSAVEANASKINKKINNPSESLSLVFTADKVQAINTFIDKKNEEIEAFNRMVIDRENVIKKLKIEFWRRQRIEHDYVISSYFKINNYLKKKQYKIVNQIDATQAEINRLDLTISEQQKKVINIDQSIGQINDHLLGFGIQGFKIIKHPRDEYSYYIQREENQAGPIFKSLSEGEKTVISFLYFVELCKGRINQTDTKQKIVVIDDPISSLSHMYVFNIAQLIKRNFTKLKNSDFIQCFILTHSLYFFHELVDVRLARNSDENKKNHQKFFRIYKGDKSAIKTMAHDGIRNDYEVYWDVVKNASHENMPLVANAMRNIIEHFFGFVGGKKNLSDIFNESEFKDVDKYRSFRRYIDRESHSDSTNLHDYKEWDLEMFTKAFREIFYLSDNENHYNKYIQ